MCIPLIKNKWALVDLAKYGTKARKYIHSDVLIGEHPPFPIFKEGDILDANATFNLILNSYDQGRVYKELSTRIDQMEEVINDNFDAVENEQHEIKSSIVDLKNKYTADIAEVKDQVNQSAEQINQCSSDLQRLTEKQERDIRDMKEYVDTEIEKAKIRYTYDDLEENLIIYR